MILPAGLNLTKTVYLSFFQDAPHLSVFNIDFATIAFLVPILHEIVITIKMSGLSRPLKKEVIRTKITLP